MLRRLKPAAHVNPIAENFEVFEIDQIESVIAAVVEIIIAHLVSRLDRREKVHRKTAALERDVNDRSIEIVGIDFVVIDPYVMTEEARPAQSGVIEFAVFDRDK